MGEMVGEVRLRLRFEASQPVFSGVSGIEMMIMNG